MNAALPLAAFSAADWRELAATIDASGYACLPGLLDSAACAELRAMYEQPEHFRRHIDMARHNFGQGEYKYFAAPLPATIDALRSALYAPLAAIANTWQERLGRDTRYPAAHGDYLARCHAVGQIRPTPLLLRYQAGDYNCLHQDLYGDEVFPLQVAVLLSAPGSDFDGGEFILSAQRPRMQSRVEVVPLGAGDAVIFAVNERPVRGTRGYYRVKLRHGVSRLRRGERYTLGIIFHDAR
ncbi:MAG: 2OG-Fe(II) oxygenase [Gammaproteobacteria bacterium]